MGLSKQKIYIGLAAMAVVAIFFPDGDDGMNRSLAVVEEGEQYALDAVDDERRRLSTETLTSPGVPCLQESFGKGVTCTAEDIDIGRVYNFNVSSCTPGEYFGLSADVEFVLNAQARHDISVWFGTDGDPNGDGAITGTCTAYSPPTSPDPPYLDLDATLGKGDNCGDIDAAHSPLSTHIEVYMKCEAGPNGGVKFPYCTAWKQPGANRICNSAVEALPGTGAKCKCDPNFVLGPWDLPAFQTEEPTAPPTTATVTTDPPTAAPVASTVYTDPPTAAPVSATVYTDPPTAAPVSSSTTVSADPPTAAPVAVPVSPDPVPVSPDPVPVSPDPVPSPQISPDPVPDPSPPSPLPASPGVNGDPIIMGLAGQVFKFAGRSGAWYSAASSKSFQWNMKLQQFEGCPSGSDTYTTGMGLTIFGKDGEIAHQIEVGVPNAASVNTGCGNKEDKNHDYGCLGAGSLEIIADGHKIVQTTDTYLDDDKKTRVTAYNIISHCSRRWFDFDITPLKQLRNVKKTRHLADLQGAGIFDTLESAKTEALDKESCKKWIADRRANNDLMEQTGTWSTVVITTPSISFHIEYKQEWERCNAHNLDVWITDVHHKNLNLDWEGVIGETKVGNTYATASRRMLKREEALKFPMDEQYEVISPYSTECQACADRSP